MTKSDENDKVISALLRERASLVGRGLDDRVAQVDQELKNRGHKAESDDAKEAPAKRVENPQRQPPQGRSATPKQQIKD